MTGVDVEQVRTVAKLPSCSVLADETVQIYVQAGKTLANNNLAGKGLPADTLELITLYLACHFAILSEERGGLASQTVGESEERYQDAASGNGLASTRFGKTAIALDTSGTLATLAAKPLKAQFRVVGDGTGPRLGYYE